MKATAVALCLALAGLALFFKGLFLTRFQLQLRSERGSWMQPRHSRLVLLVVDALREDMVTLQPRACGQEAACATAVCRFAHNRMQFAQRLVEQNSSQTALFVFQADPPTVTSQRLKGLTTGGLPTFIDISSNFGSDVLQEDNLIDQFVAHEKRLVFMGDDTWMRLFPTQFNLALPFDSFNTRDLHTVDDGILAHLYDELQKDDWDVLIAHFLGVDHVGHTVSPGHELMASKLEQMDTVLENVVQLVDDDTLLLMFGDHGMTDEGNHGGSTKEEVNSVLLAYSRKPFSPSPGDSEDTREKLERPRAVSQVDLVPTLALLLGVPIPFGNLGSVIPELFMQVDENGALDQSAAQRAMELNAQQVHRYLHTYSEVATTLPSEVAKLLAQHTDNSIGHAEFLQEALVLARRLWTQFDMVSITAGLCLLGAAIVLSVAFGIGGSSIVTTQSNARQPAGSVFGKLMVAIALLRGALLFSNSFIMEETSTLLYLLQLSCICLAVELYVKGAVSSTRQLVGKVALVLLSNRLQVETSGHGQAAVPQIYHYVAMVALAAVIAVLTARKLLRRLHAGSALICVFGVSLYWLRELELLGSTELANWCARTVLLLCVVICCHAVAASSATKKTETTTAESQPSSTTTTTMLLAVWIHGLLVLVLVTGPTAVWNAALFLVHHYAWTALIPAEDRRHREWFQIGLGVYFALYGRLLFGATSHFADFGKLQLSAGFTGFEEFHFYIAGALLAWNTFGWDVVAWLSALVLTPGTPEQQLAVEAMAASSLASCFLSVVCATVQRRHLMMWAIFAPKLVFESSFFAVDSAFALAWILVRPRHDLPKPKRA